MKQGKGRESGWSIQRIGEGSILHRLVRKCLFVVRWHLSRDLNKIGGQAMQTSRGNRGKSKDKCSETEMYGPLLRGSGTLVWLELR